MLVLRPGALGDTLLALPALRALQRTYGRIVLYAHGPTARLFEQLGEVDAGHAFDDPSLAWLFRTRRPPEETIAWMQAEIAPSLRHALLVAPSRPSQEEHVAEYLLRTLAPLGVPQALDESPLRVRPDWNDDVLVHVGSGSPAKNWPAAAFAEVIQGLENVRLVVGEADFAAAEAVETYLGRALPRLQNASLFELATRLAGCRAYLGNDSGVSHLAGLSGARSVVLFGPTSPTLWRPLGPHVTVLPFETAPREVISVMAAE